MNLVLNKKKWISLAMAGLLSASLLFPMLGDTMKVHAATNQVFRLEAIENLTGEAITGGYVALQARPKGESTEEAWITVHMFKLNGKMQRYTFTEDDSKYDFRYKAEQLPLGYKMENNVLELSGTKQGTFNVLRDTEAVEAAVAKATYDLQIHTVPPVEGARFALEEIPKPENIESVHTQRPYNPKYDLGKIFAAWRKREEMISVAQPHHYFSTNQYSLVSSNLGTMPQKFIDTQDPNKGYDDFQNHYDELYRYDRNYWYSYGHGERSLFQNVTTLTNGTVKLTNVPYAKWVRLMRLPSNTDRSLILLKSPNDAYIDSSHEYAYQFSEESKKFLGASTKDNHGHNYVESDWIVIKGPRSVNTVKTKYVYDVYVKTAEDGNLEEAMKQDALKSYEDLLVDVDSVVTDDYDKVLMAIADLEEDKALYAEELAKLKELAKRLEKELQNERTAREQEKARELVEKAKQTRAEEDIEKAKLAVNGLTDEELKARYLEELASLARPRSFEVIYRFVTEENIELPEEVLNQLPSVENVEAGETPTKIGTSFRRVPATVNGKRGEWTFRAWDKEARPVNGEENYVGTWEFEETPLTEDEQAEEKAREFRVLFADILAKSTSDITEADGVNVERALNKFSNENALTQGKLSQEKAKLDRHMQKVNELRAARQSEEEKQRAIDAFKSNPLFAKNVNDVTLEDENNINALLAEYNRLDEASKERVAAEKSKLDQLLQKVNELKAARQSEEEKQRAIDTFKSNPLFAKNVNDVTLEDENNINALLAEYNRLDEASKERVAAEKSKLDQLLQKVNELKAARQSEEEKQRAIDAFKSNPLFTKNVNDVTLADENSLNELLVAYARLDDASKAKVAPEKTKLDAFVEKILALKKEAELKEKEKEIRLPKGVTFGQWYPEQIVQVPKKLKYYDGESIKLEGLQMTYVRYVLQEGQYVKESVTIPYEEIQKQAKGWNLILKTPIAKLSEATEGKMKIRLSFELENVEKSKE